MAAGFTIVQAGSTLQAVSADGTQVETLVLPSGVTIDATVRGQFFVIARQILFTRAPSVNLWIDPVTFTVRPMVIEAPATAPVLAAGSGTGLTGDYIGGVTFAVLDGDGNIINESPMSPLSNTVTLADDDIDWSSIPVSVDTSVNARVLYRSLTGGDAENLFQRSILANNVATTVAGDNTADSALGLLPAFLGNDPPPGSTPGTRLELAIAWQNRILGVGQADPDELRWCEPNQFYAWPSANGIMLTVRGEDRYGCQGFLPRRSELVILKRARVLRFIGSDNSNFELIPDTSGEGVGCQAPLSCVVIDDVGYFLGFDGVYRVDSSGVQSITRGKVDPWFLTDTYFTRSLFPYAIGAYNDDTHMYELHLADEELELGRWIAFDIRTGEWYGRHVTSAFTPTARASVRGVDGQPLPAIGADDGYIYLMNQTLRSDLPGDGSAAEPILPVWESAYFDLGDPDMVHYWGDPSFHVQNEFYAVGPPLPTDVPPAQLETMVGEIVPSWTGALTQALPLNVDRARLRRFGVGRLMRFRLTHPDSAGYNLVLRGMQIPVRVVGRR
jgi:hypothetical protein